MKMTSYFTELTLVKSELFVFRSLNFETPQNNSLSSSVLFERFKLEREKFFKMGLTWDEFLKLATVITNMTDSIYYFNSTKKEIKEKNRRVAAAAEDYLECFNDFKHIQFMNEVRISFTIVIIIF